MKLRIITEEEAFKPAGTCAEGIYMTDDNLPCIITRLANSPFDTAWFAFVFTTPVTALYGPGFEDLRVRPACNGDEIDIPNKGSKTKQVHLEHP